MDIRKPVWAGQFYPSNPETLSSTIQSFISGAGVDKSLYKNIHGVISPHAGYPYSGPVAGWSFRAISGMNPETVVVISPSHRSFFPSCSIYPGSAYSTPLGKIPIRGDVRKRLSEYTNITVSSEGHRDEHALEVQLPFLQHIYSHDFGLIPIIMGDQSSSYIHSLARALSEVAGEFPLLIIASSDLSHFHPQNEAEKMDRLFSELLQSYDTGQLLKLGESRRIEACGLGPVLTLLEYGRYMNNPQCSVLKYDTSATASGDYGRVVGYLSAVVYGNPA